MPPGRPHLTAHVTLLPFRRGLFFRVWNKNILYSIGFVMSFLVASVSLAAPDSYYDGTSGDYTNANRWSVGVPLSMSNSYFTNNSSYSVSVSQSVTNAGGNFNAKGGTVIVNVAAGNEW